MTVSMRRSLLSTGGRRSARGRLVAAVLEGVRAVHDDVLVREAVVVRWAPAVGRIDARQVRRFLEDVLELRGISRTSRLHSMVDDLHGVVAERDPPEGEINLSAERRLNLVDELLRPLRQAADQGMRTSAPAALALVISSVRSVLLASISTV